jgi:transposase
MGTGPSVDKEARLTMPNYLKPEGNPSIPVQLTEAEFDEFILEHLPEKTRGPLYKVPRFKVLNYILKLLYMGCQWKMLPIDKDDAGRPEIHYSQIFRIFQQWLKCGSFLKIFENSVFTLHKENRLDTSITHGDGTTTIAKKGGNCLGYSGHKHTKGEKVVAFVDRNCNVLSPMVVAPGNRHEGPLFGKAFDFLKDLFKRMGRSLKGGVASLDSAYDSRANRKKVFNTGMIPNIKENPRNRKKTKRGRKRLYDEEIFEERFRTVERVFAWEDKFKRLLLRFERISLHHFGLKLLAYTMINLRHFCG